MTDRFAICVAFVLAHETEYNANGSVRVERDPNDPGGTTKFGIDQRSHPHIDVASLTLDQAKQIYFGGEWTHCCCAFVKPGWDLAIFDAAVNIGQGKAVKLAQQAAGVTVDGFIGPLTIAAINGCSIDSLNTYLNLRDSYYRSLPSGLQSHYLRGWENRIADVRAAVNLEDAADTAAATGDGNLAGSPTTDPEGAAA